MHKEFKLLDHGYVKLIDHMGSDLAPLEAARMSTDNPTGVDAGKDDRLRTRLWGDAHSCYDEQTEVLVKGRGFLFWDEVSAEMELGIWDPEQQSLCYEVPEGLVSEPYEGQMYRVDHGGVDLLVTPNHNMWVRLLRWDPEAKRNFWKDHYSLVRADELGQRSMVRYCKVAPLVGEYDHTTSLAELRLMGFFIGDGSAGGSRANGITFHLKKKRKINFLREVCEEEGLELRELAHDTYVVCRKGITHTYRDLFYTEDREKCVPPFMLGLPLEAAEAVLEGLRASDGSEKRGTWQYSTSVESVAHHVQLLALHAGEAAHINTTSRDDGYRMWNVMFLSRMTHPIVNQGKQQVSWEQYEGQVYCARTRTGILVVRRNGKIALSGNSPFEMCELVVEIQCPMFVLRQMDRHRTATIDNSVEYFENYDEFRKFTNRNEFSGRYSKMPDLYYMPPMERIKKKGKANKQGSEGALSDEDRLAVQEAIKYANVTARKEYENVLKTGCASELARLVLPQNQYTKIRMKACLLHWLKFFDLRLRTDVQEETRAFAQSIAWIVRGLWPKCWDVFEEHNLYSSRLTRTERLVLHTFIKSLPPSSTPAGHLEKAAASYGLSTRQLNKLLEKLVGPDEDLMRLLDCVKFVDHCERCGNILASFHACSVEPDPAART